MYLIKFAGVEYNTLFCSRPLFSLCFFLFYNLPFSQKKKIFFISLKNFTIDHLPLIKTKKKNFLCYFLKRINLSAPIQNSNTFLHNLSHFNVAFEKISHVEKMKSFKSLFKKKVKRLALKSCNRHEFMKGGRGALKETKENMIMQFLH